MARTLVSALLLCLACLGTSASVSAQATTSYIPHLELPRGGTEIIAVFFSTSSCIGNRHKRLGEAVHTMKTLLASGAKEQGHGFAAIGVAAEWSIDDGLAYLMNGISSSGNHSFGAWDEIHVGRNWLNASAVDYVWRDPEGSPTVPQVIVIARSVQISDEGIRVGVDRVLARLTGSDKIVEWVDGGALLAAID